MIMEVMMLKQTVREYTIRIQRNFSKKDKEIDIIDVELPDLQPAINLRERGKC